MNMIQKRQQESHQNRRTPHKILYFRIARAESHDDESSRTPWWTLIKHHGRGKGERNVIPADSEINDLDVAKANTKNEPASRVGRWNVHVCVGSISRLCWSFSFDTSALCDRTVHAFESTVRPRYMNTIRLRLYQIHIHLRKDCICENISKNLMFFM